MVVTNLRSYIVAALLVMMALGSFICYEQGIFGKKLPYDEEQHGLNKQITLHFSHVVAENTPKGQAVIKFAELVEKRSNTQIQVEIAPNGMHYNDLTELQALKNNDVQMIAPTFSKMTAEVPSWGVLDLPYLFQTNEDVGKVFNGPIGQRLLQELDDPDIKALSFWQNGFKQMLSDQKNIVTTNDFKNLHIRAMPSDVLTKQFQTLGANLVTTSFEQVLTDSSKDSIDAMENTLSNIYSKKFYLEEPYLTLSNHGILGYSVLINQSFWSSLSMENQKIIRQSLADVTTWNIENAKKTNEENLKQLRQLNLSIRTLTPTQRQQWRTAWDAVYRNYQQQQSHVHYLEDIQAVVQH